MITSKGFYKLIVDEDFKRLIPPLSADERKQLEENIRQDGCRDAIVVWGKTIIDGHNRYEICTKHKISFALFETEVQSREEAVAWICANQLGRRNISEETRRYLIGKRYEMEKRLNEQRNAQGLNQHSPKEVLYQKDKKPKPTGHPTFTSERLANDYRVSPTTIVRFGAYAHALDVMAEAIPEFHKKIVSGELKVTQENVIKIARLSPTEMQQVSTELMETPNAYFAFTDERGEIRRNTPNKIQLAQMNIGAIKEMPEYDPDAEILSLVFTIPSWVSSINRVQTTAKFSDITVNARNKIKAVLGELKQAVDSILDNIMEDK